MGRHAVGHTLMAGFVCGLVGWTGAFAVFLAGLRGVGANPEQAASGLFIASIAMGLGCLIFSWRWRQPITMAWSTPGAALLATSTIPATGFAGAVAAFMVTGGLLIACGAMARWERLVERIPSPLASAMLTGVLIPLIVLPFRAVAADPAHIAPVIAAWLATLYLARRWAIPVALVVALMSAAAAGTFAEMPPPRGPHPVLVMPAWDPAAMVALGIPLFIVTMTSQNIAGIAVLRSFGYSPRLGPTLVYGGAATAGSALLGGQAINLAAISASLAASPEAHPDPDRRWVAGAACGVTYIVFGALASVMTSLVEHAPAGIIATVAGLALVPTFAAAGAAALHSPTHREACAMTIIVAAAGISFLGIGGAFWGLILGGLMWALTDRWHRRQPGSTP